MIKRLSREGIYESEWINLYIDKVEFPSGKIIEKYHQLDYPKKSVVVVITNGDQEICFIKAIRYTSPKLDQIEWEVPSGIIEKMETVIQAAKREAKEETGFDIENIQEVYSFYPSNGMSNQVVYVTFASVKRKEQAEFDTDEVKEVCWLTAERVKKMIMDGEIVDGISLTALLLFLNRL